MGIATSRVAKVVVGGLVVLGAASVVGLFFVEGPGALAEPLLIFYLCLVAAYGVFTEDLDHPRVQAAFGVGIAAYGAVVYAGGASVIWLVVAIVGLVLVVRNLADLRDGTREGT